MRASSTMRPFLIGHVYRVTFNYSLPTAKRRHLERIVGRLIEIDDHFATFRTSKRVTHTMPIKGIVELRFVEEGGAR
jgi:hypothetical protein